ncbi:MAG: uroporphyrinogen-III synthase [Pseudomonadales bacterium]
MNVSRPDALKGLPILLTRPQAQAGEWTRQLLALGAHIQHIPTLAIEPLPLPAGTEDMLRQADFGVFVSANAVNALAAAQNKLGFTPVFDWLCVGKTTEKIAAEHGFAVRSNGAIDSETLLHDPATHNVSGQRWVIVRGQGGRTMLGDTLSSRGATVDYCELYRRDGAWQNADLLASYLSSMAGKPHVIIASSADSLNYTFLLAEKREMRANVQQATILVPGKRVANAAMQQGARHVVCADSIRMADIVAELEQWWTKQQ